MGNKSARVKDPEEEKKKEAEKAEAKQKEMPKGRPEIKRPLQIVRVAETDLDGSKPVKIAIRKIRGISHMMAKSVSKICKNPDKHVSDLTDTEIKELEDVLNNLGKHGIPLWQLNRRRDPDTGEAKHLITSQLQFTHSTDINKMKKIKSYKGIRHSQGLPVRGQRTRSSFRVAGKAVGVVRAKQTKSGAVTAPAAQGGAKK